VNECKNWETKFNELYLKYLNLAACPPEPSSSELDLLRQENMSLKQQLREKEGNQFVPGL
jgi:hypothetical protein